MIQIENNEAIRINARKTDAFDIFNFKFYIGANPYLNTRSLVFDFSLTGNSEPLQIEDYVSIVSDRYPHLAVGESVDVPSHILETFFESGTSARIPIMTFNKISVRELQETIDRILLQHPDWTIGAVCRDAVFVNRSEKVLSKDYNTNVQNLLRHPKLDLLIAEYDENTLEEAGMFYLSSVTLGDFHETTPFQLTKNQGFNPV
jgi:hypothetical protein